MPRTDVFLKFTAVPKPMKLYRREGCHSKLKKDLVSFAVANLPAERVHLSITGVKIDGGRRKLRFSPHC